MLAAEELLGVVYKTANAKESEVGSVVVLIEKTIESSGAKY